MSFDEIFQRFAAWVEDTGGNFYLVPFVFFVSHHVTRSRYSLYYPVYENSWLGDRAQQCNHKEILKQLKFICFADTYRQHYTKHAHWTFH